MLFNMPSSFGLVSLPYLFVFYPPKCKLALVPTMRPMLNEHGSEWSEQDWTGPASLVESQVQSNGGK